MEEKSIYTVNNRAAIDEEFDRTIDKAGASSDLGLIAIYDNEKEAACVVESTNNPSTGFKISKRHTDLGDGDGILSELKIEKINLITL